MAYRVPNLAAAFLMLTSAGSSLQPPARSQVVVDERPIVAAVQFTPSHDKVANRQRLANVIGVAAQHGARYVVVPELSTTGTAAVSGQFADLSTFAESIPGPSTRYFGRLAQKLRIWLGISLVEQAAANRYFVSAVMIDDSGSIVAKYRKVVPNHRGGDGIGLLRGNPRSTIDSQDDQGLRVGIVSGDDIQATLPRLASRGAQIVLVPANWHGDSRKLEDCQLLSEEYKIVVVVADSSAVDVSGTGIYLPNGDVRKLPSLSRAIEIIAVELPSVSASSATRAPLGLPSVPIPTGFSPSPEAAELGRMLFFDTNLSSDGKVSCGTCHRPEMAFTDGKRVATGVGGRLAQRNAPTLLNVAYRPSLFWDGLVTSLENQSKYPMSHFSEMDSYPLDLVKYVQLQPDYAARFKAMTGRSEIEFDDIGSALAAYQRTLLSANSAFDRYYYGKDRNALSEAAKRGFVLFTGKAKCARCHPISQRSALFMDNKFHNLGVGYERGKYADLGLANISFASETGMFLTPTLRDVAKTAPYMHDGSIATLEDLVLFFNRGGNPNPSLDPGMKPLHLRHAEVQEIVEFLRSLTGDAQFSASGELIGHKPELASR